MTIAGINHVSLTVRDLERARKFWVDVLGFVRKVDEPGLSIFVHPGTSATVACVTHADGAGGPFDERRVGLDHLALGVDGLDALHTWAKRLGASGVDCSPIVESPFGWHLNVRAPDNIAVELLVMKPEVGAALQS
jgi:glyoxylase I family protein